MPPFTTVNGQTGYYYGGQFVPATQQEYDAFFNPQQTQNNPYLPQSIFPESIYPQNIQPPLIGGRQDFVQQGTIQSPETATTTNEQKVMQAQGDDGPILGVGNMPYVKMGNEYGVKRGKSFFGFDAMTAGGHPLNTATNTVYNTGDLTTFRKQKIANPFVAEVALIQSQNTQNALNALNNPTAPTQTQVTSPVAPTTPEITPNPTADQSGNGNWVTNMFNRSSVTGVPNTAETATKTVEGGVDVLGDWGNWGFSGKEFFKSDAGKTTSAIAGAGVGVASGLLKSALPDKYDPRVGMSKPGGNILADSQFTQIGLNPALMAATGGISALVGGGVDLVKNVVKYAKQKDRYENKKLATDTMQSIDDARENMKPDYTGYARFGTQVKNPYIKKYSPGGETNNTTYDPTTSYARPKKVVVNGKEMSTYSNEYRDLYNTGNLMSVDHEGLPNMYGPEVEVTAKMTDEERDRRLKKQSYDPNLTERENKKKYEAKKDIQEWMKADINQPGGLQRGAEVMSFPLRAAGAGINLLGEIANTPLALMGEAISGRNDFSSALPSLNRASNNAGLTGFAGNPDENTNQQMTPGNALFPNNPYAAFLLDLPADVLLSRGANTLFKTGSKYLPKIGKALLPTKLDSPSYVTNTFTDEIPQRYQTYKWSEKNPETGEYDVFEEQFGIDEIPTRDPISDPFQKNVKMKSLLQKEDGTFLWPIMDYLRTKKIIPKTSWSISDELVDPVSGRLSDGNTRYWLNKRYDPKYGLGDNKYRVESKIGAIAKREKFKPKYSTDEPVKSEWVGDITSTDYKAQIEAVKARAKRMLSQEDKWVGQNNAELRGKFENAHLKHFPEGNYDPEKLGTNVGREYTLVSKGADLSNANKARVAAHETGHYYRNTVDEANEWNSFFDFSNLKNKTRVYLSGKSGADNPYGSDVVQLDKFAKNPPHGNEIRERAAQLKDYIAEKKGLGPDQDFIITEADLDDAIANYVNYTGLDNSMSAMLSSLKDKKGFLNAMNKYALGLTGVGAAGVGTSELMQQQKKEYKTGGIVNPYLKKHI